MFVWIASYPKSGNTWVRLLLESLENGGAAVDINARSRFNTQPSSRSHFDDALGVASAYLTASEIDAARPYALGVEAAEGRTQPYFRKVHDAWRRTQDGEELFPKSLTQATFYIVRDPRDVAISYAHHCGITIDDAIGEMADEERTWTDGGKYLPRFLPQRLFSWSRHVESWLDDSGHPILLVRYEDLLANPMASVKRICNWMDWGLEDVVLEAAVNSTRFEVLADQEKKTGFLERSEPGQTFFRKGQAGGWRNVLNPSQVERIESIHGTVMQRLGFF